MLGHPDNPGFMLTRGSGIQFLLANGMTVSIQWSAANYCANRSMGYDAFMKEQPSCATAETAIWNKKGDWIKRTQDACDTVEGWQTPDDVVATLAWAASLPEDFAWPVVADPEED